MNSSEPIWDDFSFDPTAFMSGQNMSKQWLCENLERVSKEIEFNSPNIIYVLGGWYCLTNLMLRVRGNLPIERVYSFDANDQATKGAMILNEPYIWKGEFVAKTMDVNDVDYGYDPQIVINTSVEHMLDKRWFDNIPDGTLVAIQATNMPNEDHKNKFYSVDDFAMAYPLSELLFSGSKHFEYQTWGFDRFMLIGLK